MHGGTLEIQSLFRLLAFGIKEALKVQSARLVETDTATQLKAAAP